ncbi:MAG TPA: hypothetical protein VHZ56_04560 [Devosia sp.]|nr:hypothetical protein [Devosia sp.]
MPPARPQQMSDPADKSDDLIAELAKLMATPPAGDSNVRPLQRPQPPTPSVPAVAAPQPVRIPGMEAPRPAAPAPQPETRGPVTGSIRIPGMDQPAPVSTSAPVGKFDFGKPIAPAPIVQQPISSLSERLAAAAPPAVRLPSDLKPVSENRSFGAGPAVSVAPQVPAARSDFNFDFGFSSTPPTPANPPRATPDPIADLINAEPAQVAVAPQPMAPRPATAVTPMLRTTVTPQPAPARPAMAPLSPAGARPAGNAPIPLKPVSVAPRSPEADRFAISPGVGLNMRPAAGQPLGQPVTRAPEPMSIDDTDPMSEIESLIGEAVRVELSPGPVRVQASALVAPTVELEPEQEVEAEIAHREPHPAPVVPPLTTSFAPRRAGLKDDRTASGAEDAILAAAAATGARVDRVEPAAGDESPYRRLKVKPQRSSFLSGGARQYVGMAVAATLLLAAGLGLYWVLNMGRHAPANGAAAPQLTADTTPIKEKPQAVDKSATSSDLAKSPVLQQMEGVSQAASSEQLISTDQAQGGVADTDNAAAATTDNSEGGLANRKVRTVTVRPDGTIVSGDDAVAGATELPVQRPNVPDVPSSQTTDLLDNATTSTATTDLTPPPATTDAGAAVQTADAQSTVDPTAVAPVPMSFPVRTTSTQAPTNTSVNAVVGAETPNGQIDLLAGNKPAPKTQVAAADALSPQSTTTAAPTNTGGATAAAYVQLSSQPSQAAAQASLKAATAKYGSLFGGNQLMVQQVDLGTKGVRWRVRLPADSLTDAGNICAQIKAQGGDCFATNG